MHINPVGVFRELPSQPMPRLNVAWAQITPRLGFDGSLTRRTILVAWESCQAWL